MMRDPIVEEIHEIRKRLWEECDGDFTKYLARLRERAAVEPGRIVTLQQRRREKQTVSSPNDLEH